jgi:hypothetical protein
VTVEQNRPTLRDVRKLYTETFRKLKHQWTHGPLDAHRMCCIDRKADRSRFRTSGLHRCGSLSCRPGDPWGCSMLGARLHWDRTLSIFSGWVQSGGSAYATLFEIEGAATCCLTDVLDAAQLAITRALGGGTGARDRESYGVQGTVVTTEVALTVGGGWVVRKYVMLALEEALADDQMDQLSQGAWARWSRAAESTGPHRSMRKCGLRRVLGNDLKVVTQRVAGCISACDWPEKKMPGLLELEWSPPTPEIGVPELAYWFRTRVSRNSIGEEFSRSTAATGRFSEYAIGMLGRKTWNTGRIGTSSENRWRDLVSIAREIGPRYIDGPFPERVRRTTPSKK